MSRRIDTFWTAFDRVENVQHDRCVDLFHRPDGSFGSEAFGRDVEDAGVRTPVASYSGAAHASRDPAWAAAVGAVAWSAASS